jgi:hypothetical protein
MRLKGEDVADGLREWIKGELKEAPRQAYDLGKFFFSVSAGTIGAITALEKLNAASRMDTPMVTSMALLFVSILLALNLAMPRTSTVGGETDLLLEYEKIVTRAVRRSWLWFASWCLGTLAGAWAVRA